MRCLYFDIAAVKLRFGVTFGILTTRGHVWTFYNDSHMLRGDDRQGLWLADVISISYRCILMLYMDCFVL